VETENSWIEIFMNVNWMSLILVLMNCATDVGNIGAGMLLAKGHAGASAIVASVAITIGKVAVVFGQNQSKPGPVVAVGQITPPPTT
jgi:hypothetical protein